MSSSELKLKSKDQLQGKKGNAAIVVLVYFLVAAVINLIFSRLFPGKTTVYEGIEITSPSTVASIVDRFVTIFLGLGLTSYYMKIVRGEEVSIGDLFSKGNLLLKAFVTSILTGLVVFGGSLLLVIPGIILAFGYTMINYVYIDNPEIGIIEVMKKSREMMKGYKWDYFVFNLSFIGWVILLPFTLCILAVWLVPYMTVAEAIYYDRLKAKAK